MPRDQAGEGSGAAAWRADRARWYAIFAAFAASCLLYRVVIAFLPGRPTVVVPGTLRTALYVAAAGSLLASIAWTRRSLEPRVAEGPAVGPGAPTSPAGFLFASVVAMALAEGSAALGFVLVAAGAGTPAEYLAFGAGAFLVLVLVILPRGLRFWSQGPVERGSPRG